MPKNFAGSLVLACLGLALLSNHAAAAPRFIGKLIITAPPTGTCSITGNPVGSRRKVQFAPANVGDNGPDSSLSIIHEWGAENLLLANASFDATSRTVSHVGIFANRFSLSPVSVRFVSQAPVAILPTTNFVNVVGVIRGWIGGPACNVPVRISMARSVN